MELWTQIAISMGVVLSLLGGFYRISTRIRKDSQSLAKELEAKFEAKLVAQRLTAKAEKMEEAAVQLRHSNHQGLAIEDIRKGFEEFHKKHIRQTEMQFNCHFTTLEALNKLAHKEPINGEIEEQIENLKDFMIKEITY